MMTRLCPTTLCALILATAQAEAHGQVSLVLGGSLLAGSLQTPFVSVCTGDRETALGTMPHAGIGIGSVSLTAGYIQARGVFGDCRPSTPRADGVYRERDYRAHGTSIYGWSFQLRYSPLALPFLAYGGAGYRFGGDEFGGNQFVSVGAALRTPTRFSVFAGGEVTHLRTQFIAYDRAWQDGVITASTEVDRGFGWRRFSLFRIGLEYRWQLTGRNR